MGMIDTATQEPFSFFTINMKCEWEKRFRKNLFPILPIPRDQEFYNPLEFSHGETKEESEEDDSDDGIEEICSKSTNAKYGKVQKTRRGTHSRNSHAESNNSRWKGGGPRERRGLSYKKEKQAIVYKGT